MLALLMGRLASVALAVVVALPLGGLAVAATEAPAQDGPLVVRIEDAVVGEDGTTRLAVSVNGLGVGGAIDLDKLEIVENGVAVTGLAIASSETVGSERIDPAVVLAMDVSGSAEGAPLAAAQAAAMSLIESVSGDGVQIGVVSFGPQVSVIAPLSADRAASSDAIRQLDAAGATALYDGVARATRMLASHDGPRDIVVFSDGEDTASTSSLDNLRALLADTEVRVTTVLLNTGGIDTAALQAIADASNGSLITVDAASGLGDAFASIAADLSNRVQLEYVAAPARSQSQQLNIVATYRDAGLAASDGVQVLNLRLPERTPPVDVQVPRPPAPLLANEAGLAIGVICAALLVLLLALLILNAAGSRRRQSKMDRRLAAYDPRDAVLGDTAATPGHGRIAERASNVFEALPRPSTFDQRIAADIEHADWPIRVGEFSLLILGSGVASAVVFGLATQSLPVAVLMLVIGAVAPVMALRTAVSRRRAAFAEQLPTVLQVMAGALRAGHAFSTAIEGTVPEVDEPSRSELRRASVEARLGRPMEQALLGVAQRMDSVDLRWVVGALAVQRQVGGNLAEVMNNVAATLRARASVKRQVKALSAEGRLSAGVIGGMPFFIFVILSLTNPDYIEILFQTFIGRFILAFGALLLLAGIFWLKRVVRPIY